MGWSEGTDLSAPRSPSRRPGRFVLLPLLLLIASCAGGPPSPRPPPTDHTEVLGRSVRARPIEVRILGDGAEAVLVMGAIHGNEPAGAPLVATLGEHLAGRNEILRSRRIILLPVANPDGLAAGTRVNANGVDLNRNFPTENFRAGGRRGSEPLSEPESRLIHRLIEEHRPVLVISVHQPLALVDWDGPGEALAREMGELASLPARRLGGRPGSLGSFVGGDRGVPIITLELPADARNLDSESLWARYGPALMVAVTPQE